MAGPSCRDVIEKAFERLFPALAYLYGPKAGLAANMAVFATWLLRRIHGASWGIREAIERDRKYLVELRGKIEEAREKVRLLEKLASTQEPGSPEERRTRGILKATREELERLEEEYELVELRLIAFRKLAGIGGDDLLGKVNGIIEDIERGRVEEAQYRLLKSLEECWRRRQITMEALRRIIEGL